MWDFWNSLPTVLQDATILVLILGIPCLMARKHLEKHSPWPLVAALLLRYRWANGLFVGLIAISVGMGIGLTAQERGLRVGLATAADKFDMIVAAPGSELTLTLATVFLQPTDVPLLDGEIFNEIAVHPNVSIAAPLAFGDSYDGHPVVGTIAAFVTHLAGEGVDGRMWRSSSEALIGSGVDLVIGDRFVPAHGHGEAADPDAHDAELTVVGRLPFSGTPWDRAILVPVEQVWEVHGLANGHTPERADQLGPPFDPAFFPGTPAVIVRPDALWASYAIRSDFTRDAETMAFFPGTVLAQLYRVMGDIRQAMSLLTMVTLALVTSSVLLGLFILTRLFRRQMAMLRALGAPSRFVVAVVWSYASSLIAVGTLIGVALGFLANGILSAVVTARTHVVVETSITWSELHLAAGFLAVATLITGLVARAALRHSILDGLRA